MSVYVVSDDSVSSSNDLPDVALGLSQENVLQRSISIDSDTTEKYHSDVDTDAIFDQMRTDTVPLKNAKLRPEQSTSSASSGYVSNGSKRSVESVGESSRSKRSEETARKKQKMAGDRANKQVMNEMNKIYKPGECMKYMNIEAHPNLISAWYMVNLAEELPSVQLIPCPDVFHEGLLILSRRKQQTFAANDGQAVLTEPTESADQAILIQTAEEIAPYVLEHKLTEHLAQIRTVIDKKLTLIVLGAKDYYKTSGRRKQTNKKKFSSLELEMAFTDMLVSADCDALSVDTPNELARLISNYTKAIAEAPFKLAKRVCDEQADFYMRGDNKKCVLVDKNGNGLSRLWQQMIAILPLSSLETARAVCSRYKSPLELFEAWQLPDSVTTLADIGVDRANVPGARSRRLGPEFARKLSTLFSSPDGDTVLE